MKNCSESPQIYIQFSCMIKTYFLRDMNFFSIDNTMEYCDTNLCQFISTHGTIIEGSCLDIS